MRFGLLCVLLALGCSTPAEVATSPRDPVSPVSDVVFSAPTTHRVDGGPERWLPGTTMRVRTTVTNTGPALMDYPSLELASSDERVTVEGGLKILYGLTAGGDPRPFDWQVEAAAGIEPGTVVTLTLRAFAQDSDRDAGRDPIGRATCEVTVGQALSEGR